LDRGLVLRRVVLEDARHDERGIGRRAKQLRDPSRHLPVPLRADQKVEPRRGAIHLADLREAVTADVDGLVDPEAIAEIRDLHDDRRLLERGDAGAIDNVLVGTGHPAFLRSDIVAQHREAIERRERQHAVHQTWLGTFREREPAVVDIDHRPSPEISIARDKAGVGLRDLDVRIGTGRHCSCPLRRRRFRWCTSNQE
jgi:hypothetical protein